MRPALAFGLDAVRDIYVQHPIRWTLVLAVLAVLVLAFFLVLLNELFELIRSKK